MVLLLALACAGPDLPPPLLPQAPEPLEPAEAVAAADVDGDGRDELFRVRAGRAAWRDQQQDLGGVVGAVARADLDGDGRQEALLGTGIGRGMAAAPARVWALGADGAHLLWEREGPRNQVTGLTVVPGQAGAAARLFLSAFADERVVEGGWLSEGRFEPLARAPLAMRMLPVDGGVLVGRLYGEEPRSDGWLERVGSDGSSQRLSSHRGVRALASADLDQDGRPDWLVGDGWHFAYGEQAQPTLRLIPGDPALPARVIARFDSNYAVQEVAMARPADGGPPVLLVTASSQVYLLQRDALGWAPTLLSALPEGGNAVFAWDDELLSVVVAGRPASRIPLRRPSP